MTSIMWFRRDLRRHDHPALAAAAAAGEVLPLFVVDPRLAGSASPRARRLLQSVASLDRDLEGALVIRTGRPEDVVPDVADEAGAGEVHISLETTPFGRARDRRVYEALTARGIGFTGTGSPYAVTPGRVRKADGSPFKVFTPFSRAWRAHGWPAPAEVGEIRWADSLPSETVDADPTGVGEQAALERWQEWRDAELEDYGESRNRPDLDSTSRLSIPLKYGEIHPRTLLADVTDETDPRFVTELCWREFYADVLHHNPASAWQDLNPLGIPYDNPAHSGDALEAWKQGRTGYPIVDAGMRQLLAEGWMHNRVRMLTASFLTKDLHLPWQVGAQHFLDHLLDGDIASNNHGWQWVAGTGTDAAPYFRVFNPTLQGQKFDPLGDYVRRWVPELRHLAGAAVHEPWKHAQGKESGYPAPIVAHDEERRETLMRYENRERA